MIPFLCILPKKNHINIWNVSPPIFLLPNTYVYILPLLLQWNRTTLSTYGQCHSLCFFLSSKTHTEMIPISFMNTLLHSSTWNIFILFLFYLLIRLSINPSSLLQLLLQNFPPFKVNRLMTDDDPYYLHFLTSHLISHFVPVQVQPQTLLCPFCLKLFQVCPLLLG